MNSADKVMQALARELAGHITRKCILAIQSMKDTLSSDDSGLTNAWDEICVQVQDEHSFFWDTYDEIARDLVAAYVDELKEYEKEALWSQTGEGWDWYCDTDNYDGEIPPVFDGDIVNHIVNKYLYVKAGNWSNERIREYMDPW